MRKSAVRAHDKSRALKVAALVSAVLLVVAVIEYQLGGLFSGSPFLLTTILPAFIFFACIAPLAFFESTLMQRFLIFTAAIVLYCAPLWIFIFDREFDGFFFGGFVMTLFFRFLLSFAGFGAFAATIVYSIKGLGTAKPASVRRDDIEEDSLVDNALANV